MQALAMPCGHRDGVNINNHFLSRRSSRRATGSRVVYSALIEGGRCEGLNPRLGASQATLAGLSLFRPRQPSHLDIEGYARRLREPDRRLAGNTRALAASCAIIRKSASARKNNFCEHWAHSDAGLCERRRLVAHPRAGVCHLGVRAANTHRPTTGLVPRAAFRIVMVLGPMLSNTGPRLDTRTRLRDGANDRIPSSTHRVRHVFGARHMQPQSGPPKWG